MLVSLTLIASIAYSTWKSLPSGEKVFTPLCDHREETCRFGSNDVQATDEYSML